MQSVYVCADNIISPLGFTTADNFARLLQGTSGIRPIDDGNLFPAPFHASLIRSDDIEERFDDHARCDNYTRLEKMLILSIVDALRQTSVDPAAADTLLVLSTTKGNIDLLAGTNPSLPGDRVYLWKMAEAVGEYFRSPNAVAVISNACISGVMALLYASRLIQTGTYKHVIVAGGDIISEFVVSGFHSFHALSDGPCRPFDAARTGLSLGEGCGTIILSCDPALAADKEKIAFRGGAITNDANHISGPSRTGEGLYRAISRTLQEARGNGLEEVDHISAHGTATLYNDESEACAVFDAGLGSVPLNSLKGYWGHTLGAAGIIETVTALRSIKNNVLLPSLGFETLGVSRNITVLDTVRTAPLTSCLKTAAGFGGCNAAIAFSAW